MHLVMQLAPCSEPTCDPLIHSPTVASCVISKVQDNRFGYFNKIRVFNARHEADADLIFSLEITYSGGTVVAMIGNEDRKSGLLHIVVLHKHCIGSQFLPQNGTTS